MSRLPRTRRRGVTLPTLLIGLTLSVLVVALLGSVLVALQRLAHRQHEREQARAQLAQSAAVLAGELRGISVAPTATDAADLLALTDSAVELRGAIGGGVACAVTPDAVEMANALAPDAPPIAWWSDAPDVGDVVHVHDAGSSPRAADDAWHARTVVAVEHGVGLCAAGPLAVWRGPGAGLRLRLAPPSLPVTTTAGAPVRVTRRRRYALYRAGDATWQLGQRTWDGATSTLQPVAGPLAAYGGATSGLALAIVDGNGNAPAPVGVAGQVTIVARADRRWAGVTWRDSATARVVLDTGLAP